MANDIHSGNMTGGVPRMPRQPKLRSSCDGCGSAKLRCDRGQPACGRCQSLDLVCFYGVSRKTGKPPRKVGLPEAPAGTSCASGEHIYANNNGNQHRRNDSTSPYGLTYDNVVPSNAERALDGHPIGFRMDMSAPEAAHGDLFRPLLPNYGSLDFDDGFFSDMETRPITALATPESECFATPVVQNDASPNPIDERRNLNSTLSRHSKDHDCFHEAYEILGSLSSHHLNHAHSISDSPPTPGSVSTTSTTHNVNRVPLDHLLRINREALERLDSLLTCSCARSPQLTMLCASIISQVLTWYQQAAGCMENASWIPADMSLDLSPAAVPHRMSLSASASGVVPSTWSSSTTSALKAGGGKSTSTLMHLSGSITPTKMAIGSFDIDDLRVQTALKVQLLIGEMRRVARLIDQFTLHNFDGRCDEYSLYQSLDAWLRNEHSRIGNMMKEKLREINH